MSKTKNETKYVVNESSEGTSGVVIPQEEQDPGIIPSGPMITTDVLPSESAAPSGRNKSDKQLVYVLGSLGVDFETDAVVDSFKFYMMGIKDKEGNDIEYPNPMDPYQLLSYLDGQEKYGIAPSPLDSSRVIWTINHNNTPIYAIQPSTDFEAETYKRLREFLDPSKYDHDRDDAVRIDMVSIPGYVVGQTRLLSGHVVPVIQPHLKEMHSWSAIDLTKEVSDLLETSDLREKNELINNLEEIATNFVNRIYYELQNSGTTSQDRALNYAVTNIYNVTKEINHELARGYVIKSVSARKSPVCRPDSDCQDAFITFFNPKRRLESASKVFRFTIDVSRVVPAVIGEPRTWFTG